jgi:uncharacterized protein (TIGR03435 family)
MTVTRLGLILAISVRFAHSQNSAPSRAEFEAASIKLNRDCDARPRNVARPSPGRLTLECTTLYSAIQSAYGIFANGVNPDLKVVEIVGGPAWSDSEGYDIIAKANGDPPQAQMRGPMLQALLEDRFKLRLHREAKEVPIYALTVSKRGAKLERSKEGSCVLLDVNQLPPPPVPGQPPPNICGRPIPGAKGRNVTMDARAMTMKDLAEGLLSRILDRPVQDKTELDGKFDFHLEFTPDEATPLGANTPAPVATDPGRPAPAADPTALSIFTAVEEQLGLKLVPDKGATQVLVIDHAEKPTAN